MDKLAKTLATVLVASLAATAALAQNHDHEDAMHEHPMVEAPADMSVSLEIDPDPVSGYNLHVVTTGFTFAPEHAGGPHVPGEGHAYLHVNGEMVARIYGAWFHLGALPPGENEVRITLNANDHSHYAVEGEMVADSVLLVVDSGGGDMGAMASGQHDMAEESAAAAEHQHEGERSEHEHEGEEDEHEHEGEQTEHEGDEAGHDHEDEDTEHEHAMGAAPAAGAKPNVLAAGGLSVRIEPLLDVSGELRLALSLLTEAGPTAAALDLTATSPSGRTFAIPGQDSLIVAELDRYETGRWSLQGSIGGQPFETSLEIYQGRTDLDTDVVAILAPAPAAGASSELYLYAFYEGENIHARFLADLVADHTEDAVGQPWDLLHEHFMDRYDAEGFTPMANTTTLAFPMAGTWLLGVDIIASLTETATIPIEVPER